MNTPALQLERLLTAEQVAELLQVSESMVYKLRRTGALPAVRVGALLRFNIEAVRAYMRGEPSPHSPRLAR